MYLYIYIHHTKIGASAIIIANNEDFLFVMSGKKVLNSIKPIPPVNPDTGVSADLGKGFDDSDFSKPMDFKEVCLHICIYIFYVDISVYIYIYMYMYLYIYTYIYICFFFKSY
jgi:hypothetical protein